MEHSHQSFCLAPRCRGPLESSGSEPYRFICSVCGRNYFLIVSLQEVPPLRRLELPESGGEGGAR